MSADDPGYRVTLAMVHQAVKSLENTVNAQNVSVALLAEKQANTDATAVELKDEVKGLRVRLNNAFYGIGGGIGAALLYYFRSLLPGTVG